MLIGNSGTLVNFGVFPMFDTPRFFCPHVVFMSVSDLLLPSKLNPFHGGNATPGFRKRPHQFPPSRAGLRLWGPGEVYPL
jgi:hypothetical protein